MARRPHVLVNMAVTADGKIDTVARRGARISGPVDTASVDRLRADVDAILVGGHTLLREDPRLTVRDERLVKGRRAGGRSSQPMRIGVVSRIGRPGEPDALPADSRFLGSGGGQVVICTTTRTSRAAVEWLEEQGARVLVHGSRRVELSETMAELPAAGIERLLVEGGSTIVAAFLAAGLVDELRLAMAPLIVGGETAPTPVGGPGVGIDEAIRLRLRDASPSADGDVVIVYDVEAAG